MPLVFGRSIFGFAVVAGPPAPAWTDPDLTNASYDSVNFSVFLQDSDPSDLFFHPDGTKVYVLGANNDSVYQYNLSTAWDLTTASYNQSFSVSSEETFPRGLFFKSDGTKMYVLGFDGDDVNEYNLSTAWDISTASYSQNFSVASQETGPNALSFKSDGTKMYVMGNTTDNVNEYNLSTAWDISTSTYNQAFSVQSEENNPHAIFFNPNGTKMYVLGVTGDDVNEYDLSTGWDVSTASYLRNFSVTSEETFPQGLYFKSDGSKMYIIGSNSDKIFQYSTVAPVWTTPDIANASYDSISFSVATQDTLPQDVTFKSDGTKMYIVGNANNTIFQYGLSTAWDVSTASYESKSFSVNTQEPGPADIFFKPDGSKFYVCGFSGAVYQYSMSTAWDISTASYDSVSFSTSTQETSARGVVFKSDGTKMFVTGTSSDAINEYSLSTAWDISTASYTTNFSVSSQETVPQGLFFNPDGDRVWVIGNNETVYQYSLTTGWDVSTASYDSVSFSVSLQMTGAVGVEFKSDGSKMYVIDVASDNVYQYST